MLLFRRLDKLLGAVIPAGLLIALGTVCLVIPGLVLAFLFIFVSPVVLVEGLGGRAALRRSVELVKSDWLRVALVALVFGVLHAVASMLAGLLIPHSAIFMDSLISDLITMVLLPDPDPGHGAALLRHPPQARQLHQRQPPRRPRSPQGLGLVRRYGQGTRAREVDAAEGGRGERVARQDVHPAQGHPESPVEVVGADRRADGGQEGQR